MGDKLPALAPLVLAFQRVPPSQRLAELQRLIGPQTDDAHELHRRALLVTALHEANLYPERVN